MIIARILKTPDGTTLNSKFQHDFCSHIDKNGKTYMLDGGCMNGYYRCSSNKDQRIVEYSLWDDIKDVREVFHWGVQYSKNKKLLKNTKWTKLKNLSDDHLDALFDYSKLDWQKILWCKEKLFRAEQEYD